MIKADIKAKIKAAVSSESEGSKVFVDDKEMHFLTTPDGKWRQSC